MPPPGNGSRGAVDRANPPSGGQVARVPFGCHYLHMRAGTQYPDARPAPPHTHDVTLDKAGAAAAADVFRLLADATRLSIVWQLREAERSVNELALLLGRPSPAVSQHLAKLRLARLVSTRRVGTTVFYRLDNDHVARLVIDALSHTQHTEEHG